MTDNKRFYESLRRPPAEALRTISSGRLRGMSDVNPQWRIKAMTEIFGPCGFGWRYSITNKWLEPAAEGEVCAFVDVELCVRDPESGEWSAPIPGTGGSKLVAAESHGLHTNDECFKMALTDALSVAMKSLGVAADIYAGLWDGTKYRDVSEPPASANASSSAAPSAAPAAPAHNTDPGLHGTTGEVSGTVEGEPRQAKAGKYDVTELFVRRNADDKKPVRVTCWHDAAKKALSFRNGDKVLASGKWHIWLGVEKFDANSIREDDDIPF